MNKQGIERCSVMSPTRSADLGCQTRSQHGPSCETTDERDLLGEPVRDSFGQLEQAPVGPPQAHDVLEIYEARPVIEAAAAAAAAERHTPTDRIRLSAANSRYQELTDPDPIARVQANVDFHATIWEASHNRAYADVLERLNLQFLRFPNTTLTFPGRWEQSQKEHQELTDAILRRQAGLAGELARLHTEAASTVRVGVWEAEINQDPTQIGHDLLSD